jgi:hypothetical protein
VGLRETLALSVKLLRRKMAFYFLPPTVEEGPAGYNKLHIRYKLTRGITVIKENGVYRQARYPYIEELQNAEAYYLGGHKYEVSVAEKASLEAAGYTVITE